MNRIRIAAALAVLAGLLGGLTAATAGASESFCLLDCSSTLSGDDGQVVYVDGDYHITDWHLTTDTDLVYCLEQTPMIGIFAAAGNGWSSEWTARSSSYCSWPAYGEVLGKRVIRDHVFYRLICTGGDCRDYADKLDLVFATGAHSEADWQAVGWFTGQIAAQLKGGAILVPR